MRACWCCCAVSRVEVRDLGTRADREGAMASCRGMHLGAKRISPERRKKQGRIICTNLELGSGCLMR